jgi:hypothetical protein
MTHCLTDEREKEVDGEVEGDERKLDFFNGSLGELCESLDNATPLDAFDLGVICVFGEGAFHFLPEEPDDLLSLDVKKLLAVLRTVLVGGLIMLLLPFSLLESAASALAVCIRGRPRFLPLPPRAKGIGAEFLIFKFFFIILSALFFHILF